MKTVMRKALLWAFSARDRVSPYPLCRHLSHRAHLPCWHWVIWQSYCPEHNASCFGDCAED